MDYNTDNNKPLIFVTNDDGIHSAGIRICRQSGGTSHETITSLKSWETDA